MRNADTATRSPWLSVLLLIATVTATGLWMLGVMFWAQVQGSMSGLVLAITWPWLAALIVPILWGNRRAWLSTRADGCWPSGWRWRSLSDCCWVNSS